MPSIGIIMAQIVLDNPNRPEIRQLVKRMIDSQTVEINQRQQWYPDWYQ